MAIVPASPCRRPPVRRSRRFCFKCTALLAGLLLVAVPESLGTIQQIFSRTVDLARLDAIVVTEPIRPGFSFEGVGGVLVQTVAVRTIVQGEIEGRTVTFTIAQNEWGRYDFSLRDGQSYILELVRSRDSDRYRLARASEATDRTVAELTALSRSMPKWSPATAGISVICIPERFALELGEDVDLWFGIKNVGSSNRRLSFQSWPRDGMAHVEMDIRSASGKRIEPLAHPHVTLEEIDRYFSELRPGASQILSPGEDLFFRVPRVASAKPGWGYKERLEFRFYPMPEAGNYRISAWAVDFLPGLRIATEPFTLKLRRPHPTR